MYVHPLSRAVAWSRPFAGCAHGAPESFALPADADVDPLPQLLAAASEREAARAVSAACNDEPPFTAAHHLASQLERRPRLLPNELPLQVHAPLARAPLEFLFRFARECLGAEVSFREVPAEGDDWRDGRPPSLVSVH